MPAIQLAELKKETAKIAENFSNGDVVIKELTEFFEFYSNRTHRINPNAEKIKVIATYRISQPIISQLITELKNKAKNDPESAFGLADKLWNKNYLEFRILAAHMIGAVPASHGEETAKRLLSWGKENTEESISHVLASNSLLRLISEAKPVFIQLVSDWLNSEKIEEAILGLEALTGYLKNAKFEDLPAVFRLIRDLTIESPRKLHPFILNVIKILAQRTPQETVFFLRQCLAEKTNQTTIWLIRNSLKAFSPEIQESLKKAIRNPSISKS